MKNYLFSFLLILFSVFTLVSFNYITEADNPQTPICETESNKETAVSNLAFENSYYNLYPNYDTSIRSQDSYINKNILFSQSLTADSRKPNTIDYSTNAHNTAYTMQNRHERIQHT